MNDSLAPANPSNSVDRPNLPPLRIHHLMVWMAVTAVLISAVLWFDRTMRNGPPIENMAVIGALTIFAIAVSGALCCAAWGLSWRRRAVDFPVEPGEQLMMLIAAAAAGFVAAAALSLAVFFLIAHEPFPVVWYGSRIVLLVALIGACVRVARRRCDTTPWSVVFYALAALPAAAWAIDATVASSATLVALVFAVWNDWRQPIARRWTHWFGVGVLAMIVLSCGVISLIPAVEHSQASSWLR